MYEQDQSFKFDIGVHDMLIRNSQHKQFICLHLLSQIH